jgi:hypothetical protein
LQVAVSLLAPAKPQAHVTHLRCSFTFSIVVAQYATLLTFGAALTIETGLYQGLNPTTLGCCLFVANLVVAGLITTVSVRRYMRERRARHKAKARQAQRIEPASEFNDVKFKTTLDEAELTLLPPTHAMVFHYCSMVEATQCLKSGIPAKVNSAAGAQSGGGILVTLQRPYELDAVDDLFFPNQEAALVCSIPWAFLHSISTPLSTVLVVPAKVLTAIRGQYFNDIVDPKSWYEGFVFLPPKQILRAYQLASGGPSDWDIDSPIGSLQTTVKDSIHISGPSQSIKRHGQDWSSLRQGGGHARFISGQPQQRNHPDIRGVDVLSPTTILQFTGLMRRFRADCLHHGWEIAYHFTDPEFAKLILRSGLRMSTQGQRGEHDV